MIRLSKITKHAIYDCPAVFELIIIIIITMEDFQALLHHGIRPGGENYDSQHVTLNAAVAAAAVVVLMVLAEEEQQRQQIHRPHYEMVEELMTKKRSVARRQFDYQGAYGCIMRDHR